MNKYFALEHENFKKVYLYLCELDKIKEYRKRLREHGFTDVQQFDYWEIDNRMHNNTFHPHVELIDESLYPGDMFDMRRDPYNHSILRYDMDNKYGFIRCFISDPICFYAMVNLEENGTREQYDQLYESGLGIRASCHSVQEIEDAELSYYTYDIDNPPSEEDEEEDLLLFYEFSMCK